MTEFSFLLKDYVDKSDKTIYQFSKELGIDRSLLNKQINGRRLMNKDVFLNLVNLLNLTASQKSVIYDLYNKEALGSPEYETFNRIKNNFIQFTNTVHLKTNKQFYENNSLDNLNLISNYDRIIHGSYTVYDVIKKIATEELNQSQPRIYFNFDMLDHDLSKFFSKIYTLNNKINLKNITTFSSDDSVKRVNFSKFINLLPLLLNGYRAHYTIDKEGSIGDVLLLFPYYMITSTKVILVAGGYDSAIVFDDKDVVDKYADEFEQKIQQCDSMQLVKEDFAKMPSLLYETVESENVEYLLGIDRDICILPFLSKEQYITLFGEKVPEQARDYLSQKICDYYDWLYSNNVTLCFHSPIESFYNFVNNGVTTTTRDTFLPLEERISIIKEIRESVDNDTVQYYLYDKDSFFWPEDIFFDVISKNQITFYYTHMNEDDENCYYLLELPQYLLDELIKFILDLNKTTYVYSKQQTLSLIDDVIKYAEEKLRSQ